MHVTPLWEQVLLFRNKSPRFRAQKNPKQLTWSGFGCCIEKLKNSKIGVFYKTTCSSWGLKGPVCSLLQTDSEVRRPAVFVLGPVNGVTGNAEGRTQGFVEAQLMVLACGELHARAELAVETPLTTGQAQQ
jgi:hypothetical protein